MKILYGLAGEGFGHSSRAREIIPYLQKKGHEVKVLTYGQALKVLKKDGFDVFKVYGMHLIFDKNKLNYKETLKEGLTNFLSNAKKAKKIYSLMKENFDLCITDMEPLVSMLSKWYSLPLLSIDNQHRLVNLKLKIPEKYQQDYLLAKHITNLFASRADYYIITNFGKAIVKKEYKKNTFLVPPIVRKSIRELKRQKNNFILVYLTKKNYEITNILKQIDEHFVVYGFDIEKKEKNLVFHKTGDNFLNDLSKCKAIIATSGFTLISESLYLKKPYFAIPLKGQFVQVFNALILKDSGFGDYSEDVSKEELVLFLKNTKKYEKSLKRYKFDYNLLFKTLDLVLNKIQNEK